MRRRLGSCSRAIAPSGSGIPDRGGRSSPLAGGSGEPIEDGPRVAAASNFLAKTLDSIPRLHIIPRKSFGPSGPRSLAESGLKSREYEIPTAVVCPGQARGHGDSGFLRKEVMWSRVSTTVGKARPLRTSRAQGVGAFVVGAPCGSPGRMGRETGEGIFPPCSLWGGLAARNVARGDVAPAQRGV